MVMITIMMTTGKPGRPGELMPVEVTPTRLKLLVGPPEDDGGSPVSGYAVYVQQTPMHRWVYHATVVPDLKPAFTGRLRRYHAIDVGGLEVRERYRVRVSAVNHSGFVGPPSTSCCHKPGMSGTYVH